MVQPPIAYDPTPEESVSETVVRALADARNECACEMTPQLYRVLDPDALDRLYASAEDADRGALRVAFTVDAHRVVVDGSRRVFVSEANGPPRSTSGEFPGVLRGAAMPWQLVFDDS